MQIKDCAMVNSLRNDLVTKTANDCISKWPNTCPSLIRALITVTRRLLCFALR